LEQDSLHGGSGALKSTRPGLSPVHSGGPRLMLPPPRAEVACPQRATLFALNSGKHGAQRIAARRPLRRAVPGPVRGGGAPGQSTSRSVPTPGARSSAFRRIGHNGRTNAGCAGPAQAGRAPGRAHMGRSVARPLRTYPTPHCGKPTTLNTQRKPTGPERPGRIVAHRATRQRTPHRRGPAQRKPRGSQPDLQVRNFPHGGGGHLYVSEHGSPDPGGYSRTHHPAPGGGGMAVESRAAARSQNPASPDSFTPRNFWNFAAEAFCTLTLPGARGQGRR
jgi:hypothetical protein